MNTKKLGLVGTSAIVMGNIMGSGIALLPPLLALIGSITIISWAITLIGAIALAYVFARLGILDPKEGGPVAYAKELSSILGYQTGLLYWAANWIGNLAIAITGIEYLSYFYAPLKDPVISGLIVIGIIWLFTLINCFSPTRIAKIVSITMILLLIPVIGTTLFGWMYFSIDQFYANWNVSKLSNFQAVFAGIVLAIWSFIGIESASVGAGLVKNPKKTIPFATMLGTGLAGTIYIGFTTVIFGMFPAHIMAISREPLGRSFEIIVGTWVQPFVSVVTAIACIASLGSWMMIIGQAGMTAAKQGTLPGIFRKVNAKGIPALGIIMTSLLMTTAMLFLIIMDHIKHDSTTQMFQYVISTAVLIAMIPYFYSSLYLISIDTKVRLFIILLAIIFCFTAFIGSTKSELNGVIITSFVCLLFYCLYIRKKGIGRANNPYVIPWR